MTAAPSVRIDARKYSRLLAKAQPSAITSEEENDRMLAIIDQLMSKGEENLTPEESALFDLIVTLIEKFETEQYHLERSSRATPLSILRELMAARDLKPSDLWEVFRSKGLTSEVLNGKRAISKSKAKALAEFFHVSAELFI
ncbi:MAG: transcriptional regulator [Acidobacteria bacterium]|nr:MAG: transcriptional regulator [Acidobacteriota bacterium]